MLPLSESSIRSADVRLVDAVTFDFWNTLMWEEPGSLKASRLQYWAESLDGETTVDLDSVERAHDAAHERYVSSWKEGQQFRVSHAVDGMLAELGGPREALTTPLVRGFSEGGRRAAVHVCPGAHDCLAALKRAGVRVGVICDIGLTPSTVVRELLARERLVGFFDDLSFSDEVGLYKPAPAMFAHALANLGGVPASRAAHVGDRPRTDVGGARAAGMISVRYTAIYDDADDREADADIVTGDLRELPALIGIGD
jgi:putative hydrolase of the HAD superfamily